MGKHYYESRENSPLIGEKTLLWGDRFLVDPEKSDAVAKHFGPISGRFVLYRGDDSIEEDGVRYLNVERYLNGLGGTEDELKEVLFPERGRDHDPLFPRFF